MFAYVWPMALVVLANLAYQICARQMPHEVHPLAALTVTYLVGAGVSLLLYFLLNAGGAGLRREYAALNWTPLLFGVVLVGLEVGFIYAYRAGWPVSTAATVQSAFLAVALIVVGWLCYGEAITINRLCGIACCLLGLWFINRG